jgi:ornithine cyclodeaminase/alanine dehydrogenase-like protein (mu-crystallin family)
MLAISEKDILEAVTVPEVIDAVEQAFRMYERKEFLMPDRMHIEYKENTLLLMPCFTEEAFGTKLVSVFPGNAAYHVPALNGIMVLNDIHTGIPMALINGPVLTALRTGGVGSASIRHLSPEDTSTLGIVGTGVQGYYQAYCAAFTRPLEDIYVFDQLPEKIPSFVQRLSSVIPEVHIHAAANPQELLEKSIIVVTTTNSSTPVLPDDQELLKGKHFVGIGSFKPGMREYPESLFHLLHRVFIDTDLAIHESGDLATPIKNGWITPDQVATFGRFLESYEDPASIRHETTFFKSVGMALFDVSVSKLIYENVIRKGLGKQVDL